MLAGEAARRAPKPVTVSVGGQRSLISAVCEAWSNWLLNLVVHVVVDHPEKNDGRGFEGGGWQGC
jgi:hypothetical protein